MPPEAALVVRDFASRPPVEWVPTTCGPTAEDKAAEKERRQKLKAKKAPPAYDPLEGLSEEDRAFYLDNAYSEEFLQSLGSQLKLRPFPAAPPPKFPTAPPPVVVDEEASPTAFKYATEQVQKIAADMAADPLGGDPFAVYGLDFAPKIDPFEGVKLPDAPLDAKGEPMDLKAELAASVAWVKATGLDEQIDERRGFGLRPVLPGSKTYSLATAGMKEASDDFGTERWQEAPTKSEWITLSKMYAQRREAGESAEKLAPFAEALRLCGVKQARKVLGEPEGEFPPGWDDNWAEIVASMLKK